ncbi:fatty-acid-binding protein 2-like [Olea europaea var. sylvestris]|uniref:Fatty-acid-binding 2 n=1 Tax=Olea europaea subsp. europaea TaxID=158383 RepID=A0A8S0Q228_OLEEU|nr:fatty-acid-binding protein 2-like [Olea europaea var. sylvestris]CAA2961604.1 fatty-acid-binding 2 [Olea europaea subsp. europaea]
MGNNWLFFIESDGGFGSFSMDPLVPHVSGHWLLHVSSFVDNSRYFYVPGSLALQEAFNCVSKFAGALLLWFAGGSNSHINNKITGDHIGPSSSCKASRQVKHVYSNKCDFSGIFWKSGYKGISAVPAAFGRISRFTLKQLIKEAERLQSLPVLSLASALVPPITNVSSNGLAIPLENASVETQRCMDDRRPCEVETGCGPCGEIYLQNLAWSRNAVEPRTGIQFPTMLDNIITGENTSFTPEVLVGTGSRTMTIIRIKSLKLYAFGFYVHPSDVCEKLGPKYACIPEYELNKRQDFYQDLLREDINMTVRLVVSCNGIKINTVRDAFEKSLRARLMRTNPDADHHCLQTFGSIFSQDIPLHVGTTINFHRTADGKLITEVGGNQLGAVQSKDLCRAFFDMYIGDVPVCEQTKEEIGKNVASIVSTC